LKILQVFNRYLQPGGEEKSVARIASDLESGGHSVTRFWRESAEWQQPGAPPKWKQPFLLWRNRAVLEDLRRLHEATHTDIWLLHNVVPVVSLDVYRLASQLQVPVIQWLHNYRPFSPGGTMFAGKTLLKPDDPWISWKETLHGSWNGRFLTAWLAIGYARIQRRGDFDSVRAWVAVSEQMKQIFEQANWFPDRLHALPHSWHAQPIPADARDEGYFLFLGRMVEAKGVRFLIELWRDPALRDVQLVMAGDGPLVSELRSQSPPNVRWVGHVEGDVKQKLKAGCRAILFPSIWPEPLSTVAYEAYEMNKPILASNQGGMPEIIRHNETGLLLEPGDAAGWRAAVQQLDELTSRRLGDGGRRWLQENVTSAAWNRQFDRIVGKALPNLHSR
jgi:glycosyltransferase involved in cell wall biosynthesis